MREVTIQQVIEMHERVINATGCVFRNDDVRAALETADQPRLREVVEVLAGVAASYLAAATPESLDHQRWESITNSLREWIACRDIEFAMIRNNLLGTEGTREAEKAALQQIVNGTVTPDNELAKVLATALVERSDNRHRVVAEPEPGHKVEVFRGQARTLYTIYKAWTMKDCYTVWTGEVPLVRAEDEVTGGTAFKSVAEALAWLDNNA